MRPDRGARFTIDPAEAGRLDRVLAARFPGVGRRRWAELLAAGWVKVNGARTRKGDRVKPGDEVTVRAIPAVGSALAPVPERSLALDVLHQDARLVAVAKPTGWPVCFIRRPSR